jgi:zinc protease
MRTLSHRGPAPIAALAAALLALAAALQPAAAAPVELTRRQDIFDAGGLDRFAAQNLPSFTIAALDNGIPVVIKRSTTNRILTVKTVLLGHVSLTPLEKAGLESVTLKMLTRGSARYPYSELQRILFEKSSSIGPSSTSFDASSFDLVTIDSSFDELFAVYADALLHPAWNAEEFPRVMNDFKVAKQQAENDPWQRTVRTLHEEFFAGHPYAASWDGAGGSLESITLQDVRSYYEKTFVSGRMVLVAVGDFEPARLLRTLNASFGRLERKEFTRPAVPSFEGKVTPDLVIEPYAEAEGTAYVRGDFALPSPDSPDYPAVLVAFNLLDDLLFEIVRTRHGACYSVWSTVHGFTAGYGDITVYQTSVPGKVKQYVDEAIAVLLDGRCLAGKVSASAEGKSGIGREADVKEQAGVFVPIAEALPFYKLQSVTRFYAGQQTNISVASQIASSIVYQGDCRDYLLMMDRISRVSAAEVQAAARRYLEDAAVLWIALGDTKVLKDVKREDFTGSKAR